MAGMFAGVMNSASSKERNQFKEIYYKDIVMNKDNFYSMEGIEDLAKNIEICGLLQPLVVTKLESGNYMLLSGHRRYSAIKKLINDGNMQFENIACIVANVKASLVDEEMLEIITKENGDVQANKIIKLLNSKLQLIVANTHRDKTQADMANEIRSLSDIYEELRNYSDVKLGKKRDWIAQRLNLSDRQVQTYLTILDDEEFGQAILLGEMSLAEGSEKVKEKKSKSNDPVPVNKVADKLLKALEKALDHDEFCDDNSITLLIGQLQAKLIPISSESLKDKH